LLWANLSVRQFGRQTKMAEEYLRKCGNVHLNWLRIEFCVGLLCYQFRTGGFCAVNSKSKFGTISTAKCPSWMWKLSHCDFAVATVSFSSPRSSGAFCHEKAVVFWELGVNYFVKNVRVLPQSPYLPDLTLSLRPQFPFFWLLTSLADKRFTSRCLILIN
jgi:hypothetical protein